MRCFAFLTSWLILLLYHGSVFSSDAQKLSDLDLDQQFMYSIYVNNEWCTRNSPGYAERIGDTYVIWANRHEKEISALKANPNFETWAAQTNADNMRYEQWANTGTVVDDIHATFWTYGVCSDEFIAMMNIKDLPDARFSTPTKTYKLFIKSMVEGDYRTAYICLTRNGTKDYINYLMMTTQGGMPPDITKADLPELLDDKNLVEKQIDENTAEVHDTRNSAVMTFRKILGNWKSTFWAQSGCGNSLT